MQVLRGMVVSRNSSLTAELENLLSAWNSSFYCSAVSPGLDDAGFKLAVSSVAPSIAFIDLAEDPERGIHNATCLRKVAPELYLVGIGGKNDHEALYGALRAGIRDVVDYPIASADLLGALNRAKSVMIETHKAANAKKMVLSFLPAKVGSGASTIALNTACAVAAAGGQSRVALMDLDFDLGIIDFMLRLPDDHGLDEMSQFDTRLDDSIWSRFVTRFGELDVLRAGSSTSHATMSSSAIERILGFARGKYEVICVDLPGVLSEASTAVLEHSDHIFLVCTAELPSVHLTRRRLKKLREMNLEARTRIVYNRCRPGTTLSRAEMEELIGGEVFITMDNDYATVQNALMNGQPVDSKTYLGRSFASLAASILGKDPEQAALHKDQGVWAKIKNLFNPSAAARAAAENAPHRLLLSAPAASEAQAGGTLCLPAPEHPSVTAAKKGGRWIEPKAPAPGPASKLTIDCVDEPSSRDLANLGMEVLGDQPSSTHRSFKRRQAKKASRRGEPAVITIDHNVKAG